MKKSFTLGGKTYSVTRAIIEAKVKGAVPKAIEKHYVEINGVRFPPKQVIALAAGVPLGSFTTTDAARILASVGFKIQQAKERGEPSEDLFGQYLAGRGLRFVRAERAEADYAVPVGDTRMLLELKRLASSAGNESNVDPYGPLRRLLANARDRFHACPSGDCCSLVLAREAPDVYSDWRFVYGAMLPPVVRDLSMGTRDDPLSAVLVIERLPVGQRRFQFAVRDHERHLARPLTAEEYWQEIDKSRGTERDLSLSQLRVVVHENPLARVPLPDVFHGPYDERYGLSNGRLVRVWAGDQIAKLDGAAA